MLNDISIRKFGNTANQNPLRYIKYLETFFELRAVLRYARLVVVKHSLYANCIGWYDMHVNDQMSYEEFKDLFLRHYWDQCRQSEIRFQIMNGKYDPRKHGPISEYFILIGRQARFLDPEILMGEFIFLMANQYTSDVRSALIESKPQGHQEVIRLLKELQPTTSKMSHSMDTNKSRDQNSPVKKSESNHHFLKEGPGHDIDYKSFGDRSNLSQGTRPPQRFNPPPQQQRGNFGNKGPNNRGNFNGNRDHKVNFMNVTQDQGN